MTVVTKEVKALVGFIKKHCPCWADLDIDAECAGTPDWSYHKTGTPYKKRFNNTGMCWPLHGKSCAYFEKHLLENEQAEKLYRAAIASSAKEPKIKHNTLTRFVREECANWRDKCIGIDIWGDSQFNSSGKCRVMIGKPCKYFKNCVLGSEDYRYPRLCFVEDPAYETKVRSLYRKIDHTIIEAETRRCGCGAALKPRQQICDKCKTKKRRKAYRQNRDKQKDAEGQPIP